MRSPGWKLRPPISEDGPVDVSGVEEQGAGAVVEFVDVAPAHRDHEHAFTGLVGGDVVVDEAVAGCGGGRLGGDAVVEFVEREGLVAVDLRVGG